MDSAEIYNRAKETAKKTKLALRFCLPGKRRTCGCKRCWPKRLQQSVRTIERHETKYGLHMDAALATSSSDNPPPSVPDDLEDDFDVSMRSYRSGPESPPLASLGSIDSPHNAQTAQLRSRSSSLLRSEQMTHDLLSPRSQSSSGPQHNSDSWPASSSLSQYMQYMGSSGGGSLNPESLPVPAPHFTESSEEVDPYLHTMSASADVDFFGRDLANLSISGAFKPSCPPLHTGDPSTYDFSHSNGDGDPLDDDPYDDYDRGEGGPPGGGNPGDPDGQDGVEVNQPQIQVPPDDAGGIPRDPGDDNEPLEIPAFEEHPTLRNIYLRTWALYAFSGVTQEVVQAVLESHQSALLASADLYPPDFIAEVHKMPTTLRSLERRLGMNFSELMTVYPLCPTCGKRYTMEELYALLDPQCLRYVGERCTGNMYVESTLADGTLKRTPIKSLPYVSFPDAIGRLLSRVGLPHFLQHWRGDDPNNAPLENPPEPRDPQEWFDRMHPNTRFGDISRGSGWHAQATGMSWGFNNERHEYVDEPTGDAALSLARMPLGLNLGVGADGYQVFRGKFASAGSYSANGIYIVINNFPFFLRNQPENMILALVLPGPAEPKGYAFDQMVEPFVNDLIRLANGMLLPVYDVETGEIQQRLVYANLSVLIVDWISRIKCTGHVGVTAEENHCPYCRMRQCQLASPQGYQPDGYELRDPHEHLQDKHRWLRAPEDEREEIRLESGTVFTEFDRIPGFFAFDNAPVDAMHLLDLGVTRTIAQTIILKNGMLRKRLRGQDYEDSPEGRLDAFLARTIFPYHCSRLPSRADTMDGRTKAEQWRLLRLVMPVAYFEAWRVDDAIPNGDILPGGQNTLHFKAQARNAQLLHRRRCRVHIMDEGDPDDRPQVEDCFPSRNPRDYYGNILRFCVGSTLLTQHKVTLAEIGQAQRFLEQVGVQFTVMNVHLTPSFHAATHLPDHVRKYGNIYNTLTARFERANRMLANVNINGHGRGVLEATMAKGFLRRTECYHYVTQMQSIEEPSADDIKTTGVLLGAMRNGPEHEVQHGMLEAVLAGEAPIHGQEEIRLAMTPAQVNFRNEKFRNYYQLMVNFCNNHRPEALNDVTFYGFGQAPDEGLVQLHIRPAGSTLSYPHFRRYGIRYGSARHSRGLNSRYGYIHDRVPVIIQGIYETTVVFQGQEHKFLAVMIQRFVAPNEEPAFPWNHWNNILGIDAWEYNRLALLEAVPPTAFTGVFALSDLTMPYGRFWVTIAMLNTRPEDLVGDEEPDDLEEEEEDD